MIITLPKDPTSRIQNGSACNLESISQAAHNLEKLEKSGVFEGARVQFAPKHDLSLAMFANSVSKLILCNLESELLLPPLLAEVLLEPLGLVFLERKTAPKKESTASDDTRIPGTPPTLLPFFFLVIGSPRQTWPLNSDCVQRGHTQATPRPNTCMHIGCTRAIACARACRMSEYTYVSTIICTSKSVYVDTYLWTHMQVRSRLSCAQASIQLHTEIQTHMQQRPAHMHVTHAGRMIL